MSALSLNVLMKQKSLIIARPCKQIQETKNAHNPEHVRDIDRNDRRHKFFLSFATGFVHSAFISRMITLSPTKNPSYTECFSLAMNESLNWTNLITAQGFGVFEFGFLYADLGPMSRPLDDGFQCEYNRKS
jgi:hypothetical protein